jgi:ribosomal-protein-alanine N-acetyltransferase
MNSKKAVSNEAAFFVTLFSKQMTIRNYKAGDHEACLDLFRSNVPKFFDPVEEEFFEQWLVGLDENRLAYSNTEEEHYYVVEENGKLQACGGYYIAKTTRQARMCWGMVDNKLHRKGIGRKFLEFRIAEIKKKHPGTQIALDTSQHSYQFFEKMDFKVQEILKDHYAPGLDKYEMSYIPAP